MNQVIFDLDNNVACWLFILTLCTPIWKIKVTGQGHRSKFTVT